MSNRIVLEEEQYVETLEHIIERDFFPDLPSLRKRNEKLQRETSNHAVSTLRSSVIATGETAVLCAGNPLDLKVLRRVVPPPTVRSEGSSWDQPTPTRLPLDDDAISRSADQDSEAAEQEAATASMGLNRFVATHTSEDNAAFTVLQNKAIEAHKQQYHWAYDDDRERGDPKLQLLTNGEWITKEQRAIVDQVLAPKGPKDERPSAPDTWPYRARNALLFPPDLTSSKQICQVDPSVQPDSATDLLENGCANESALALVKRGGAAPRAKPVTVFANSRFPTHGDNPVIATTADTETKTSGESELELVQMTPMIAPGVDASPLMTWGDIEGTPRILDPRTTPVRAPGGPSFQIKETSSREKLASKLDTEARARKAQSRQRTPTPLVTRSKRLGDDLPTPSRTTSLRSRLSSVRSVQRTPLFGGDSELRASYGTPLLPPRHSQAGKRKL